MSSLTEDQKLVMMGLRSPNQQVSAASNHITVFQENIANDWSTFQTDFSNASLSSFSDFETWLTNNGVDANTAANIRATIESVFSSWSDYDSHVTNSTSWDTYANEFRPGSGLRSDTVTVGGQSAAGIQVYEFAGIGRAGQEIPAGGVEVFGREFHVSQSDARRTPPEDEVSNVITYSNLSVSSQSVDRFESFDVTANVTNNSTGGEVPAVAEFQVDGVVLETKTLTVPAGSTVSVTFTHQFDEYDVFEVTIGDLTPVEVVVVHSGVSI